MTEKHYTAWQLVLMLMRRPFYRILLCADDCLPPSPWTDKFRVEIDKNHKVIRLSADFT